MANWYPFNKPPAWSGQYRVRSGTTQHACWAWYNRTQQSWQLLAGGPLSAIYDQWRVSSKKESEQMKLNEYAAVKQG